ncbi:MAG: ATP-binding protein [Gemmatimonadota bacterium]
MGETRVDLVHLLEDLRDAYPASLEETILTEMLANSLDSGATTIVLRADTANATLVLVDNGSGMSRRDLRRYHDLAASTKRRGVGIGFAGVGIKLGLLACAEVVTETRRGKTHAATTWQLAGRKRAPWKWLDAPGYLAENGTAVALRLSNPLSPLLDAGFLEATVLRHFQPLFEPEFIEMLAQAYPQWLEVIINGRVISGENVRAERVPIAVRTRRKRKPSGAGYLARHAQPMREEDRGLAVSTLGKVIRRGWDWVGIAPANPEYVNGLIEIPELAEALTLNKGDFMRTGARGALFLAYRKAVQESVAGLLAEWGALPPAISERQPRVRPIERDLQKVLAELAVDFPLLATLAERSAGGQRPLPLSNGSGPADGVYASAAPSEKSAAEPGAPPESRAAAETEPEPAARAPDAEPGEAIRTDHESGLPGRQRRRVPTKLSLEIRFETLAGENTALGRLIESTVWINDAHPAYRRAVASRSEGYHIALAVALAVAPLAAESTRIEDFVSAFLAHWGAAAVRNGPSKPRARRRKRGTQPHQV